MKKPAKKESLPADDLISRLEEIQNKIEVIGARATWLLGTLVLVVLALASFLSGGVEPEIVRETAAGLCLVYVALLLVYIPLLILPNFGEPIYGTREDAVLQKNIGVNGKLLKKLHNRFNVLVSLIIIPAIVSLLAVGQGYLPL